MATLAEARRAWQQAVGIFEPLKRYRTAVLGDGVGTADDNLFVPNRDNYVFARDSTESSTFFEVLNLSAVQPAHNLPVIIGYPPNPGVEEEQILDVNYSGLGPNYVAADVPTTGQHHQQHEFQGGDQINVDPRQFLEGLVHPTDPISMKVVIESFMYFWDNWRKFTRTTSIDLTSYRPGSGNAVMVLITLDPETEQIRYHRGLDISTGSQEYQQGLLSVVPAPPGNEYPLGYVRLLSTNTTIDWGSTANDLGNARLFIQTPYLYFLDRLRQLEGYSGNDPNLSAMGVAGDTTDDPKHILWSSVHSDINSADVPANGDVITWDTPTNRWIAQPVSGGASFDHNHTAGANDGGKLTAAVVDSFADFEEQSPAPGTPGANVVRLYAKDSAGVSTLFYKQDDGTEVEIGSGGAGGAPTTATYWVESADATLSAEVVVGTTGITTAAYGSRQAAATAGRLFFPNNGYYIERDTGSAWEPWGPNYPFTAPIAADFTWVNQGAATSNTVPGGIRLTAPADNTYNVKLQKKTAPSVPYTVTAWLLWHGYAQNYNNAGIGWRQSSDGKLVLFQVGHIGGIFSLAVFKATSPTVWSATYKQVQGGNSISFPVCLRINDDNTNRICSWSVDGQNFHQFHSVGRTDFMTADEVFFETQPQNASEPSGITLLSWKET